MNILVLSCGRRNKIIHYFKKALAGKGQVFAADCSSLAPALYDADRQFIVPPIGSAGYIDNILAICKKHCVKGVLSLIDPELSLLAANAEKFTSAGVTPLVSSLETVELCLDKYRFYNFLRESGFAAVKTYSNRAAFAAALDAGKIGFPVVVKPVKGSASLGVARVGNDEELAQYFLRDGEYIIQEFIEGKEFGADVYRDLISGETTAIFLKEKIAMRAGETDKSVSCKDEALFALLRDLAAKLQLRGPIDVDIFRAGGEYLVSEINPRFGGGYPHAYECGVDIPKMIVINLMGKENDDLRGRYPEGVYMMKYSEVITSGPGRTGKKKAGV